ncbi:MAG: hypothetical protein JWL80_484 [Parcubacteria group bacterium]|nr:hypothetical protein [Parcubacteria group bacterium]
MRAKLLFISLFLIILLVGFHAISTFFYLYWTDSGSDHVTHIVGAMAISILGLWLCFASGLFPKRIPSVKEVFLLCLLSALSVGIVWEAFEYGFKIVLWSSKYPMDTLGDLISDIVGGICAGLVGKNKALYE